MNPQINNKISNSEYDTLISDSLKNSSAKEKSITSGKVISIENDIVTIDVGLKSEGRVPISEFSRPGQKFELEVGDETEVFIENVGPPTLACIRPAVDALQDLNAHREVQLVISGGVRNGADVAKALALGADAVSIGSAAMIAIGDNDPKWEKEYQKLGTKAGAYDDWHEGNDPAGISTQNPKLMKRLDPKKAGRKLSNYLKVMTLEAQTIARACGKNSLHNLEPEDLCALTVEAAAMARVPLAGTNWIPGIKNK